MKSSRVRRMAAAVALTGLIASCGGGTESSDTTERTRNFSFWSATTTPTKFVVYGTQDGYVKSAWVTSSRTLPFPEITYIKPSSRWQNSIVSVAVDTSRSEAIIAGVDKSDTAHLSRVNLDGDGFTNLYTNAGELALSMAYDSGTRTASFMHREGGGFRHVVHSVDDVSAPIISKKIASYSYPAYNGSEMFTSIGDRIFQVDITDIETPLSSSVAVGSPSDVVAIAQDTRSKAIYGARQSVGTILSFDVTGSSAPSKVVSIASPASLAVFTDGTMAVGIGDNPLRGMAVTGKISVLDPDTGATFDIPGTISSVSRSGIQSVWAVESPIATSPPSISGAAEVGRTLSCNDATWLGDLPLSRLSRSPIDSLRSYQWFLGGTPIAEATSETLSPTEEGQYSCAITAANLAGPGNTEISEEVTVAAAATTTTVASGGSEPVTTSPSSGGAEAVPGVSPVVTVPEVATGAPVVAVTPTLRSAKWTFKGRTAKITFKKWSGASKYRFYVRGATRKNIVCKTAKTTVTCTTTTLKKGLNTFSAKALSRSGITLALSTKTRNTK